MLFRSKTRSTFDCCCLVVDRVDHPAPAALGLGCSFRRAARPRRAGRCPGSRAPVGRLPRDPVGADQARGHRRRAHDLVAQRLRPRRRRRRSARGPAARRRARGRRSRRRRARPRRPLAARVGGPVQELSVEGHRRRAAGVEGARGHGAEPDHRLRELEVREAGAVAGLAAVDGDEDERPSAR